MIKEHSKADMRHERKHVRRNVYNREGKKFNDSEENMQAVARDFKEW